MKNGDTFYTQEEDGGTKAEVEYYTCSFCNGYHLRTKGDATTENNLGGIRRCR